MLMIQVLGVGLIPRGKGIAPKKEPFPATKREIELILEHGTLIPRMFNPKTGSFITITSKNLNKLWETFGTEKTAAPKVEAKEVKKTAPDLPATDKAVPQPAKNNPQPSKAKSWEPPKTETPKVEEKKEEKKEEEKKTDETISVTTSSDKK